MNLRTFLRVAVCALSTLTFSAQAATIGVTYSYNIAISGDPASPPLIGSGSGSVLPFGGMTWMDMAYPDLSTGNFDGTFSMTFSNGTLFGTAAGLTDLTTPPDATIFAQTLNVKGGTGAFVGYNGTLMGTGILNLFTLQESTSGSGTLNTVPEPGSLALLLTGVLSLFVHTKRARRPGSRRTQPL